MNAVTATAVATAKRMSTLAVFTATATASVPLLRYCASSVWGLIGSGGVQLTEIV